MVKKDTTYKCRARGCSTAPCICDRNRPWRGRCNKNRQYSPCRHHNNLFKMDMKQLMLQAAPLMPRLIWATEKLRQLILAKFPSRLKERSFMVFIPGLAEIFDSNRRCLLYSRGHWRRRQVCSRLSNRHLAPALHFVRTHSQRLRTFSQTGVAACFKHKAHLIQQDLTRKLRDEVEGDFY